MQCLMIFTNVKLNNFQVAAKYISRKAAAGKDPSAREIARILNFTDPRESLYGYMLWRKLKAELKVIHLDEGNESLYDDIKAG